MKHYILASASPRRKQILETLGVCPEIFVTDADESSLERDPSRLSEILSARKGRAALEALQKSGRDLKNTVLIASDTTVAVGNEILGKPTDEADARRMLKMLSGKEHAVVSGIWLWYNGREAVSHAVTSVSFAPMSDGDIDYYIQTGEPFGKAGAYAIQGIASMWIRGIRGDYFSVVGLPVNRMCELFSEEFGEKFI
jgi:septum formation protein